MSPAKLSVKMQEDFVRNELANGHRMLKLAKKQRKQREEESASQSLSMATVALEGAERHLAEVELPSDDVMALQEHVSLLRSEIEGFAGNPR